MAVRCKFYVHSVTQSVNGGQVTLFPVTRGAENREWASASPSGKIELTILNQVAVDEFTAGEEYYVDFTKAPKPEPESS